MEEILTAEQVAHILQVHPFTVLKFIKQGKLKASKLGRVYRIRKSDVDSFLDEQAEKTTENHAAKNKKNQQKEPEMKKATPPEKKGERGQGKTESKFEKTEKEEKEKPKVNNEQKASTRDIDDIDHYVLELKTN